MINKKILLISIETVIMTVVRLIQVLSFNATGAITVAWTTPVLYVLAIITFVTALLPIGRKPEGEDLLSVGSGISAAAMGVFLIVNGIVHFQIASDERFGLATLILACASGLALIFVVGATNIFHKRGIYGKGILGLPVFFILWLGFALIGVYYVDKTMRLGHLNAFSVLEYASYIYFFLAYLKEFCGFGNKSRKQLSRFALLSAAFTVPNIATKLVYGNIPMDGAVAEPYNFGLIGILLDLALLAFAICVTVTVFSKKNEE